MLLDELWGQRLRLGSHGMSHRAGAAMGHGKEGLEALERERACKKLVLLSLFKFI